MKHPIHIPARQDGAVLITALMILVVLTILSVSSTGTSVLDERMAGGYRDAEIAREAAELAIKRAETWLENNINNIADVEFDGTAASQYMIQKAASAPFLYSGIASATSSHRIPSAFKAYTSSTWSNITYSTAGGSSALNILTTQEVADMGLSRAPRVVIEYAGRGNRDGENLVIDAQGQSFTVKKVGFRITAIGWGRFVNPSDPTQPGSPYIIQSYYSMPL